jgi:hypothetical protein
MAKQQAAAAPAQSGGASGAPILRILLGVGCLILWSLAVILSIQASEAFILGGKAVSFAANWGVWMQLPNLAQGKLSLEMGKAVLYAWGVEFVYLVCVVGEVALSGRWHGWFKTGAIFIVVYDFYSDFQYGTLGSGVGGQLAFSALTAFIIGFFGWLGVDLIWKNVQAMR